jgi:G3E family GTPase
MQVEYADVVVLTQSKPVPDDRLAHVRTVVQAFNTSALVLSSAAGVAFAVLGAPKHICSFRDPLRGALNRAFRSAASPAPKPAWLAVTPTDTAAEQQLPQFHYLRRRPFHNGCRPPHRACVYWLMYSTSTGFRFPRRTDFGLAAGGCVRSSRDGGSQG